MVKGRGVVKGRGCGQGQGVWTRAGFFSPLATANPAPVERVKT